MTIHNIDAVSNVLAGLGSDIHSADVAVALSGSGVVDCYHQRSGEKMQPEEVKKKIEDALSREIHADCAIIGAHIKVLARDWWKYDNEDEEEFYMCAAYWSSTRGCFALLRRYPFWEKYKEATRGDLIVGGQVMALLDEDDYKEGLRRVDSKTVILRPTDTINSIDDLVRMAEKV